jgi:EmrB/QacA subfamily drug resistance transporter
VSSAAVRNPWVVLATTSLAVFAVFLDTTILFVAFPDLAATFPTVSTSDLSWVLNAYTIVFAAALIPAGRLADRVGRRKVFLAAVVLFTLGSVLCGAAPTVQLLIAARILQALGAAALIPASLAIVLQTFPPAKVPVAVAIWGAVGAVAGAIGPSLGSFIVESWSWRWAFYVNLVVGAITLLLASRLLPEGKEEHPRPLPDPASIALLVAGAVLVSFGIVKTEAWGWTNPSTVAVITAGVLLVGVFVLRCRAVSNPLIDLHLFELRGFRWGNVGMVAFSIAFNAMFFTNIQFLVRVWGYSILEAGLAISPGPATVAVLAPFLGRLAARIGQRALLIPGGLIFAACGLYTTTQIGATPDYLGTWLPASILGGLGVAFCLPQLSSASVQELPPDQRASGSAVSQALRNLGSTLGVALVVAILGGQLAPDEVLGAFDTAWSLTIVCGVAVTLVALLLPRKERVAVPEAELEAMAS